MTVREAFGIATRDARAVKYAYDKLRAIRASGGYDFYPYMTPDEVKRERQGLCRDLAIYCLDIAYRLAPGLNRYSLIIGDTDDPDTDPDHAWCEARDDGAEPWWSDPTNRDVVDRPGWFSTLTPQRAYTFAHDEQGRPTFVARFDARRTA